MKFLTIAAVLLVALAAPACSHMKNDDIIKEAKKCESAGLKAEPLRDIDGIVKDIQCAPVESSEKKP